MFGRSSTMEPVKLPDERGPFKPLANVSLHFNIDWPPEVVLSTLLADESRFTEHWHLKIQDAIGGVVGSWRHEGGRHRREVTFHQKIDSPLSPVRSSKCIWVQSYILDGLEGLSFELKSDLLDVPFGDAWSLYWRWVFRPAEVGHAHGGSRVTLSTQTVFRTYLLWKSKVEGEAIRAAKELSPLIEEMVRAYMIENQPASRARRLVRLTRAQPEPADSPLGLAAAPTVEARESFVEGFRMRARKYSTVETAVLDVLLEEGGHLKLAAAGEASPPPPPQLGGAPSGGESTAGPALAVTASGLGTRAILSPAETGSRAAVI
ncbi:hypothetical protein T492DRAFT_1096560 [Pavlovales sp. CCMP2436]|nr:hypothetical protein T492DRAFT_1096560 [Pavlovales sp. CCMP2436]|mmetsp:Transcript_34270/g.85364  ORF Transcript_34270/g.85364 Transcript_34270/m.85364 type:complete len:319 (+) Transcript_34270:134-1090(+)